MKKMITVYVSLVACLMFAGVATADPVVYNLTVDGDVVGGTITLDLDVAPTSTDGTTDTYVWGNAAIVDFSLSHHVTAVLFTPASVDMGEFFVFTLEMATDDDSPVSLSLDMDSTAGGGEFLFTEAPIDFGTGEGTLAGALAVTGAALTAVAALPSSSPAITAIDYDPDTGMLTLTWNSCPNETYEVYLSTDMTTWDTDLDDSIPADAVETTTTVTFDLNDTWMEPAVIPERVYFRVQK
jgi:hypothetical protein